MIPQFRDLRAEWPAYVEWMTLEREVLRRECEASEKLRAIEHALCARDPVHWLQHWCWTFDPRLETEKDVPFIPWPRQIECFRFLLGALEHGEERIVAKSRAEGYSWLTVALALHGWLFRSGFVASFGSRIENDVDQKGNPKSLFEKLRYMLERQPAWWKPAGFRPDQHASYMRLINPENGATIVGEVGANMGRSGRSSIFFVDEAAFIEHDSMVDRSVSANSNARIWGSTANGRGNVFAEKWFSERYPTFELHFRDNPRKGPEWERRTRATSLPHTFASEHDIDFSASVEGLLIELPWIRAAVELHSHLQGEPLVGPRRAGLDIGAGKAESVLVCRAGPMVTHLRAWTEPDSIDTAHQALDGARAWGMEDLSYDAPGVGAGVASVLSRADRPPEIHGVNTGAPASERVTMPDGRTARDTFANLKAQLWWQIRERFRRTHEFVREGKDHPLAELIAIPPDQRLETQLNTPQWNRTLAGKIAIVSKKATAGPSPDRADALVLTEYEPRSSAPPILDPITFRRTSPVRIR